jgi:hypothetical protein
MPNEKDQTAAEVQTVAVALRGVLLKRSISLIGTVKESGLEGVTGSIKIDEDLSVLLKDLAKDFGGAADLLKQLLGDGLSNIRLERLSFGYRSRKPKIAETVLTISVGKNRFHFLVLKKFGEENPGYLGGLEITLDPDLFNAGALSGLVGDIVIDDIGLYYAKEDLGRIDYYPGRSFENFDESSLEIPSPIPRKVAEGLNWSGTIKVGEIDLLDFPPKLKAVEEPATPPESGSGGGQDSDLQGQQAVWMKADKSVGPLRFKRIGLTFISKDNKSRLGVLFDAAISVSGLTLGFNGLCVSFPLSTPVRPKFDLAGLDLSYAGGPLQITGSFLRVRRPGMPDQFDGMALIKAADLTITGFGSYSTVRGDPSMFVFAILHKELGGPPFFRVKGLAAGFGYNRTLKLPPIEEVHSFPLVRAALDENFIKKDKPEQSIQDAMGKLRDYVSPSSGDYWFAAGVRFSSFEMIHSFAMLSVSFGHEVEIALLGLSKMAIPMDAKPGAAVAYAELAIRAVVKPEEGSIAVEGRLTDESYIFSKDCRLTGGFAFFTWLSGQHAGDFVITLGGYHPKFERPSHYPVVPRLGVDWQVTGQLSITAQMYFALTPSCLMAGGQLSVVYNAGVIKAWFIAYADFLLSWKPFYYLIDMGISIGVAVDLGLFTIRVHLSVALHIWGPEFAGRLDVDLSIVSFSIRFGPPKTAPPPLEAKEFVGSFLPPVSSDVILTSLTSGLIRQETLTRTKAGEKEQEKEELRVVNGHALALKVQSMIPIADFDGIAPKPCTSSSPGEPSFGIRPMGKTSLSSKLRVSINGVANDRDNLRVALVETGVPEALWGPAAEEGKVPLPGTPEAKTIRAKAGLQISFAPRHPQGALPPILIGKLAYETIEKPIPWDDDLEPAAAITADEKHRVLLESGVIREGDQTSPPRLALIATAEAKAVIMERNAILGVLAHKSPFKLNKVGLNHLAKGRESYFQADPEICRTGEAFS